MGKKIVHKFEVNGKEKWYTGYVVDYNACTGLYEITYDEEENCFFNLTQDISQGDLIVI